MATRFNPSSSWPQKGRTFNHGVVQPDGKVIHISGQVAYDKEGELVGVGDCGAQLRQCFINVTSVLEAVGGQLEDIVSLTIHYAYRGDLSVIEDVLSENFELGDAPAVTLVQTSGFVAREFLIQVVPIAVVPHERYHEPMW